MRLIDRQLKESRNLCFPMKEDPEHGAVARWSEKPVRENMEIHPEEQYREIRQTGPGICSVEEGTWGGRSGSFVSLEYPTVQKKQNPTGRAYTTTEIRIPMGGVSLERFSRIRLDVYIDSVNSGINEVTISLYNTEPKVIPVPGRFEGFHSTMVAPGRWTRIYYEIAHLCRSHVSGIGISVLSAGVSFPGDTQVRMLLDQLCLEDVEPEKYKGFELENNAMAYCHSGYICGLRKQALVNAEGAIFRLKNLQGETVYEGQTKDREGMKLLDFSEYNQPGEYTLECGGSCSRPFTIGEEAFRGALWHTLNFFLGERCGCAVPGCHSECHLDVMSRHPDGRMRCVAGGWHDAGDLTQDGRNTMECTLAMLEGYEAFRDTEEDLAYRMLQEARWGLDWMMRIRWEDGWRHCGRIIAFWTDNTLGTTDDVITDAEIRPYDQLLSAQVFATAGRLFEKEDSMYANLCARLAKEDFQFGISWMNRAPAQSFSFVNEKEMNAIACAAGAALYRMCGEREYLDKAADFAAGILRCQETNPHSDWTIPLTGYFYETAEHTREQAYFHRSYEHVPIQALCEMIRLAPEHLEVGNWRQGIRLYADYLKATHQQNPYGLFAAGIYQPDNAEFANMYHEGSRSVGAPNMEEYNAQVYQGIRLDANHYLRIFPVSYQFRGFFAPILSKAICALDISELLGDQELREEGIRQTEWILGFNPFTVSGEYGEGYGYRPMYTGLQPQIVGAVPVGFESWENEDIPYYPVQAIATYNEIWVHTTGRMMKTLIMIRRGAKTDGN